jgi:hypothetical protein
MIYRSNAAAHPKSKTQSMTAIAMIEDSMHIIMDEGWFDMASLVAVAGCNQQLYTLVDRADHLWEPLFLAEIKFPQTEFIDDADWKSPDIPLDHEEVIYNLRVPPRIHGGKRDNYTCFVHPRDKKARGRGLVLVKNPRPLRRFYHTTSGHRFRFPVFDLRFHQTTGILEDIFHDENAVIFKPSGRVNDLPCTYIPRALPIECKACRVMLDSYPALVSHCKEWSHRQNMESHDKRVPEEFVDPRNTQSYHQHLSVFRKVMALKTFKCNFIAFLHAPMDQGGIDKMMRIHQSVLHRLSEIAHFHVGDVEDLLSTITLEFVREVCIGFVLIEFYQDGIEKHSQELILGGWQAFTGDIYSLIIEGARLLAFLRVTGLLVHNQ